MKTVKKIYVSKKETDEEMRKKEGDYIDITKDYKIIDYDADVYSKETGKLIAKFRKNVISKELTNLGWDAFHKTSAPSRNRGSASGPIKLSSEYWKKRKPVNITKWAVRYIHKGKKSKMQVNNNVYSSVLGYFEETPFCGLPCRMTSYTQKYHKYYMKGLPFIEEISRQFRKLVPTAYKKQKAKIDKKPDYRIGNTAFSSITVNRNFRTGMHKDAGDYKDGFGNLTVVEYGKYHGGETLFPQYRIGFDLRQGDFIAMDVHEWHCNAKLYETASDKKFNKKLPVLFKHDTKTGTIGSEFLFSRISFVCYMREKIVNCDPKKTKKYYKKIGFDPVKGFTKKTKKK